MANNQGDKIIFEAGNPILDDRIPQALINQSNELVLATDPGLNSHQNGATNPTFSLTERTKRIERQLKRAQTVSEALKEQLSSQIDTEYHVLEERLGNLNAEIHQAEPAKQPGELSKSLTKSQIRRQLSGLSKAHTSLLNQGDQIKDQLKTCQIKRERLTSLANKLTKRLNDLDYSFSGVIQTIKNMQNPDEAYGALASISAESDSFKSLIAQTRRQLNEVQAQLTQLDQQIHNLNQKIDSKNSHMASLGHQLGQIVKVASFQSGAFQRAQRKAAAADDFSPSASQLTKLKHQRDALVKQLRALNVQRKLYGRGLNAVPRFIADSGHRYFVYSNTLAPEDESIDFALKRLMSVFNGVEDETALITTQFTDDSQAVFKRYLKRRVITSQVDYINMYDDLFRRDKRFSALKSGSLLHAMHEQGWRLEDTEEDGGQIWRRHDLKRLIYLRTDHTIRQIFSYDRNQVLVQVDVFSPEEQLMATQYIKNGNQVSSEDYFRKSDHSVIMSKEYRDNHLLTIQMRDRSGILVSMLKDNLDLEKWWFAHKLTKPSDVLVIDGQSKLCSRLLDDENRQYQLLPIFPSFDPEGPIEKKILAGKGRLAGILASDAQVLERLAAINQPAFSVSLIGE